MDTSPSDYDRFCQKIEEWDACLRGKDPNSIWNQMVNLVWYAGVYRVLTASRAEDSQSQSGLVHEFIDRCFFQSQMATIRRIVGDNYSLAGPKGVYSFRALVGDMKKNRHLVTREHFFKKEGRSMDVATTEKAELAFDLQQVRNGTGDCSTPRELDSFGAKELHRRFDRIAGVQPSQRTPKDSIADSLFNRFEAVMKPIDPICKHVDKFIAHSATEESRRALPRNPAILAVRRLWKAHEILFGTMNFICVHLTGISQGALASYTGDLFKNIESPLVPGGRKLANEVWSRFRKETEAWNDGVHWPS